MYLCHLYFFFSSFFAFSSLFLPFFLSFILFLLFLFHFCRKMIHLVMRNFEWFFFITYKWSRSTGHVNFFFFFVWKALATFFFFYTILILIFSTFSPVHIPHPFLSHTLSLTPHYRSANSFSQFRSRLFEIYFFFSPSPFSSSNSISSLWLTSFFCSTLPLVSFKFTFSLNTLSLNRNKIF